MSVVAEVEAELRALRAEHGAPMMRTSVLTHVAWVPPDWVEAAERTLSGLAERHPSRTILLIAEPEAEDGIDADASVRCFARFEETVCSEVVRVRLRGRRAEAPASVVLPLLISDLPAFCRWRGRPDFGSRPFEQLMRVVDRLVVDSAEWPDVPDAYRELAEQFDAVAVSDVAWSRTAGWRGRLAERWPAIGGVERLAVAGPEADAALLAGWLRSRLRREVELSHEPAGELERVEVDGDPVTPPRGGPPSDSDLLSDQLDVFARDPVYEAAAAAAAQP